MTSISKLRIAFGAGDPDPALAMRVDIVAAAIKLAELHDNPGVPDLYEWNAKTDAAADKIVKMANRYRRHLAKRKSA